MTGQTQPRHKTDDVRQFLGALLDSRTLKAALTAAILFSSLALLIRPFGPTETLGGVCDQVVAWCTALFAVDVSLRLIAQRVGFLGSLGNLAVFLIVGIALFTPFDTVLMLRLFPILKNGAWGYRMPSMASLPLMSIWLAVFVMASGRNVVLLQGETCTGWVECLRSTFELAVH